MSVTITGTVRAVLPQRPGLIPSSLARLSTTIAVWIERSRQRRDLAELADGNAHLLADIGLSREQACREAARPFWSFCQIDAGRPPGAGAVTRPKPWPGG
jgi:uncharacterized protein YjiS (DUF1127 family)